MNLDVYTDESNGHLHRLLWVLLRSYQPKSP